MSKKNKGDANASANCDANADADAKRPTFTPSFALELAVSEEDLEPFGWNSFRIGACASERKKLSTGYQDSHLFSLV